MKWWQQILCFNKVICISPRLRRIHSVIWRRIGNLKQLSGEITTPRIDRTPKSGPHNKKKHCYYPFRHYGKANIYPNRKKYTSQRQITIQNHSYEAPVYQWAQEFAVKVCQKSYGLGHEPKGGTFVLQMSQECLNNDACFGGAQLRSSEKFL